MSRRSDMPNVIERVDIVADYEVMSGDPCIEGTRIAAQTIAINLKTGHEFERILEV